MVKPEAKSGSFIIHLSSSDYFYGSKLIVGDNKGYVCSQSFTIISVMTSLRKQLGDPHFSFASGRGASWTGRRSLRVLAELSHIRAAVDKKP